MAPSRATKRVAPCPPVSGGTVVVDSHHGVAGIDKRRRQRQVLVEVLDSRSAVHDEDGRKRRAANVRPMQKGVHAACRSIPVDVLRPDGRRRGLTVEHDDRFATDLDDPRWLDRGLDERMDRAIVPRRVLVDDTARCVKAVQRTGAQIEFVQHVAAVERRHEQQPAGVGQPNSTHIAVEVDDHFLHGVGVGRPDQQALAIVARMGRGQAPISRRRKGDRSHAEALVVEFRNDPAVGEIDDAHDRVEQVAVRWVTDRCDVAVGVEQPGVLRGAVHDPTEAIGRRHREFESAVDVPPDDGASTAPGHDALFVRRRETCQEERFLTAAERLASPTPQLVTVVVVEPEHVAAIGSDRATDRALRPIGDLA